MLRISRWSWWCGCFFWIQNKWNVKEQHPWYYICNCNSNLYIRVNSFCHYCVWCLLFNIELVLLILRSVLGELRTTPYIEGFWPTAPVIKDARILRPRRALTLQCFLPSKVLNTYHLPLYNQIYIKKSVTVTGIIPPILNIVTKLLRWFITQKYRVDMWSWRFWTWLKCWFLIMCAEKLWLNWSTYFIIYNLE